MNYYPEGINFTNRKFTSVDEIKSAIANGEIVESKVLLCDKEHNLHIDLGVTSGLVPRYEVLSALKKKPCGILH